MKTLIGMREFVLLELSKRNVYYYQDSKVLNKINNYANFLSRQPQLSDFVACGKDGLPLKMPIIYDGMDSDALLDEKKYLQALDKVLFKDCTAEKINDYYVAKHQDKPIWVSWNTFHKIESLTPYNLELTDNAIKIIGV